MFTQNILFLLQTLGKRKLLLIPYAGAHLITSSGGAIANDNGPGLILSWNLAFGSTFTGGTRTVGQVHCIMSTTNAVNWMDSTSNNFYLTGVQLELGEQPRRLNTAAMAMSWLGVSGIMRNLTGWVLKLLMVIIHIEI